MYTNEKERLRSEPQRRLLLLSSLLCFLACAILVTAAFSLMAKEAAYGLETEEYVPWQDYHIDSPDAFTEQDIDHQGTQEDSGSTEYWLTCPFYLEWTSDDMTVYEGEEGYIACSATGLKDLRYEWDVSTDGGITFAPTGLVGSAHFLPDMKVNNPVEQPYIYRCIITNGDGMSKLATVVAITVNPKNHPGGSTAQTGDPLMLGECFLSFVLFIIYISLIAYLAWKHRRYFQNAAPENADSPLAYRRDDR